MKKSLLSAVLLTIVLSACGDGNTVKVVTDTIRKNEDHYSLNFRIPQVKGMTDTAAQKDINDRLKKFADDQEKQFQADIADLVIGIDEDMKSGLTIEYNVVTLTPELLSMTLEVSPFMAGAAHPNHVSFPFNYDIATSKKIAFEDLFNTKAKYLERLSELSIQKLIETSKENGTYYAAKEQNIRQGASAKLENFRTFTIKDGNLILTFDPYQVGPYAEGTQSISLTRAQITDVLSNYGRKLLSEAEKKG